LGIAAAWHTWSEVRRAKIVPLSTTLLRVHRGALPFLKAVLDALSEGEAMINKFRYDEALV
jgi:hypothetical protein